MAWVKKIGVGLRNRSERRNKELNLKIGVKGVNRSGSKKGKKSILIGIVSLPWFLGV